jgi:hypothetical protein
VNPDFIEALDRARGLEASATNISRVAEATSADAARWAFTQWDLRHRAASKFALAGEMLFDRDGLEMASDERLAAYHASRFPAGAQVIEVGCGVGSDTIALARRGPVLAYESDPARAAMARHNLRVHGVEAEVRTESWTPDVGGGYAFADPSRRAGGRRTLEPSDFSPNPVELVRSCSQATLVGMKLSPMLPDAFFAQFEARREFASLGRECRESLLWFGEGVGTFAVHIESGELLPSCEPTSVVDDPMECVFEADPAAIRAHALGNFQAIPLGDSNGYLTGDEPLTSPWLRGYRVLDHGRFDMKEVRAALAKHDARTPEIKQRGTGVDPAALRKQLRFTGTQPVVVLLYPLGKSIRYVVACPS